MKILHIKYYKNVILLLIIIFLSQLSFTQTYTLNNTSNNTTVTTCSGTFVDQGGTSANYSANSDYTITFCSGSSALIKIDFSIFNIESGWDIMYFYDGSTITSPSLGTSTGNVGANTIQSSGPCLTIKFTSDGSTQKAGWEGLISCVVPCVTPVAIGSITNQVSPVKICVGEAVNFNGSSSTAGSGFSISSYTWDYDDGTTGTGAITSHTYTTPGEYIAQLDVKDNNGVGCHNTNRIDLQIQVSTNPTFTGTTPNQTICLGASTCLNGVINPTKWTDTPPTNVFGTLALPDGSGVCYEQAITFTEFAPSQTITAGSQVQNVMANLEHSWAGDITITIICPNGQSVGVFNSDGTWNTTNISSENFGDQSVNPPTGFDYIWTSTGTTMDAWGAANPSSTTNTPIPAGTYGSEQPFTNLVGCPLNGIWKLKICDLETSDAGTIFSWGINFDPSVYSTLPNFTPVFNSNCAGTSWSGTNAASTAAIISTSANCDQICVSPNAIGTYSYKFSGTDDFGCTYDTTITVTVTAATFTVNAGVDQSVCLGSNVTLTASGTATSFSWDNGITNNTSFTPSLGTTTYTVTGTNGSGCSITDQVNVTVNPNPIVTVNSPTTCSGTNALITATPDAIGTYNYAWTVPAGVAAPGNVASFNSSIAGTYSVIITNTLTGCVSESASGVLSLTPFTTTVNNPTICSGASANVIATPSSISGTLSYNWTVPAGATAPGNVASFSTSIAGTYSVIVTNTSTGCISPIASGNVTTNSLPTVTVNSPSNCTASATAITATPGIVDTYSYDWTVPAGVTAPGNVSSFNSSIAGTYSVIITNTTTGCVSSSASGIFTITPLTATVNSPTICSGSAATVIATPSTTGTFTYVWSFPAGASDPGNVASFSTSIAGTYSVIVTNTLTSCSSLSASGNVTTNTIPTVTVNSPTVCSGENASITATPGSLATYSYDWTVPNGVTAPGNIPSFTTTVAGVYSVIITNTTTGCISTSASGTTTLSPLPTVSVNSPSTCTGISTAITATPGILGTYNYNWTVPNGVTAPGNVSTFNTSIAGTYSVIITDPLTTCSSSSANGILTLNPIPTVTLNNPSICDGNSATITATPGSVGTYSYSWTGPIGFSNPGNISSLSTTIAGTYSVIITNTITSCVSSSASGIATINPNPTVTVNNPSICAGQTTSVVATPGSAATYSYLWTVPAGVTSPGNVSNFSTTVAGNYSVIITNISTTCSSISASGIATVNPNPLVSVNSSTICSGSQTNVTATPNITGTYDYSWTVPSGVTAPGNVSNFSTSTSGNYSVIITNQTTLCSSTSASGNVNLIALPIGTINGTSTICSGSSSTITFSGTANSMISYSANGGPTQTIILNSQGTASISTGILTSTTTYQLISVEMTTAPFCTQTLNNSAIITIENAPTITFVSDKITGCVPLSINFTNTTVNSNNCLWTFGDGSSLSGCSIVNHSFTKPGCYDITLNASSPNGCSTKLTIPNMICAEAIPVAAFNPTPDIISVLNSTSTMENISTGADNYQWTFGDGYSSTETSPEHTFEIGESVLFNINLIAISNAGCRDTTNVTIKVNEELIVYIPNTFTPDGDKFNQTFQPIFTKGYDPFDYNLIIFNRWGEIVFESNDTKIGWDGTYGGKIVQDGIYTWKINFKIKSFDDRKEMIGHINILR